MMIDLTVKTLDSQNHSFSLNDDITVRQFKEHIAEAVNIPADSQRLIYCGRVLQNEKLLNEYDVNGKVIHLVQRAPPISTQRNNQSQSQNHSGSGEWQTPPGITYRHTQLHEDPMYIGSFALPADVLDGYELFPPIVNNTLARIHTTVVRRMLEQANAVVDRLDNSSAHNSSRAATGESNALFPTQPNQTQSVTTNLDSDNIWTTDISIAEINIPISRLEESSDAIPSVEPTDVGFESMQAQSPDEVTPQHSTSTPNPASSNEENNTFIPRELGELFELLLSTQDRLRPYIRDRLLSINAESNQTENQRITDSVMECFHFLSHAQHALSNLEINTSETPRTLRCRSMIVPPSSLLQAGVPIQVEAHISLQGQNEGNLDSDEAATSQPTMRTTQTTTASIGNETPTVIRTTSPQPQFQQQIPTSEPMRTLLQPLQHSAFGTVLNLPSNVEVVMETSPQASRVWSFTAPVGQRSNNNNNHNNNNDNNVTNNNNGHMIFGPFQAQGASFPLVGAPSPIMIRNLMQAIVDRITRTGVPQTQTPTSTPTTSPSTSSSSSSTTTTTTNPSSTPTTNSSSTAVPESYPCHVTIAGSTDSTNSTGQNSQTRGNTETHPTTSTQTRTTPRTHVLQQRAQSLGIGLPQSSDFDPLLPCNSHYIRRGTTSTPTPSMSTVTNTTASTQTGVQSNVPVSSYVTPQTGDDNFVTTTLALHAAIATGRQSIAPITSYSAMQTGEQNSVPISSHSAMQTGEHNSVSVNPHSAMQSGEQNSDQISSHSAMQTGEQNSAPINLNRRARNIETSRYRTYSTQQYSPSNIRMSGFIEKSERMSRMVGGSGLPLYNILTRLIYPPEYKNTRRFKILDDICGILGTIPVHEWSSILRNDFTPLNNTVIALRTLLRQRAIVLNNEAVPSIASCMLRADIKDELERACASQQAFDSNNREIDLFLTIDRLLERLFLYSGGILCHDGDVSTETTVTSLIQLIQRYGKILTSVLRYCLRGQDKLENFITRFATEMCNGTQAVFQTWIHDEVVPWFFKYTQQIESSDEIALNEYIVYKSNLTDVATTSAEMARNRPDESLVEPMEVDKELNSEPSSPNVIKDDENQIMQTRLPADWYPILAHDLVKQRRQLNTSEDVTTMSDAYLSTMPSKRRKLVEQRKVPLLMNPSSNHTAIPTSMERLIRDSLGCSGLEEADGAVAAIVADPAVRRAFGQAISESLDPLRYQTPDFPDALRFPNATKFFINPNRKNQQ